LSGYLPFGVAPLGLYSPQQFEKRVRIIVNKAINNTISICDMNEKKGTKNGRIKVYHPSIENRKI
jgi:hypothetical protein